MFVWIGLLLGIIGVLAAAIRWGRGAAIVAWLAGLLALIASWIALAIRGENGFWTFVVVVGGGGLVWAVLGGVAAVQGLAYRALRRAEARDRR